MQSGPTMQRATLAFIGLVLASACGKTSSGEAADKPAGETAAGKTRTSPFTVKVHKVVRKYSLDPKWTAEDDARAKEVPVGNLFVCVQYTIENTSSERELWPSPTVVDDKGSAATPIGAGRYFADWIADQFEHDDVPFIPAGVTAKRAECFEIPKAAATALTLKAEHEGWKTAGWSLSIPLPAS